MKPTPEMIEAGRMVIVDATGHGYSPELIEAIYSAMMPASTIVPDELVKAAEAFFRAYWHLSGTAASQCANRITPEEMACAAEEHSKAFRRLEDALSLPRRTEADIRADERERLARIADADNASVTCVDCDFNGVDGGATIHSSSLADWLRSQGGE